MRKHIKRAMRLALGVATLSGVGILGTLGAGAANATPIGSYSPGNFSPVVGHVYLDDNTAGTNTISGFDRHLDGSLTPLAGSPFHRRRRGYGCRAGFPGCDPGQQRRPLPARGGCGQ